MNLFSRRIVGWSMQDNMRSEIVVDALEMAWFQRSPAKKRGLIFHSDCGSQYRGPRGLVFVRGVEYASREFNQVLSEHRITPSMSRKGKCWDNACSETLFGSSVGRTVAWNAIRNHPPGQGRNPRLAALVQPNTNALDAEVHQPDAVRTTMAGQQGSHRRLTRLGQRKQAMEK